MMVAHNDDATTQRITTELDKNFIVEAGAGTGKTYALVSRVVALVKAGYPMGGIVAITFTEAAAAELSERIRSRMEELLNDENSEDLLRLRDDAESERIAQALDDIDQAVIQTIHSFAAQLLQERPLDAGLPPGWTPMDDIERAEHFADRWDGWRDRALGTDASAELQDALRGLLRQGVGMAKWREVAKAFSGDDRLRDASILPKVDLTKAAENTLSELRSLADLCKNPSEDRLYDQLNGHDGAIHTVETVLEVADSISQSVAALYDGKRVDYSGAVGTRKNWLVAPKVVRDRFREVGRAFRNSVRIAGLTELLRDLQREFAVQYEADRKADGVAGFQDLLAWARDLLRDNKGARSHFQGKYSHILIDEFQDTDPLQAEIAFYLAATASAPIGKADWYDLPLEAGKLFIVGDPKQSIYRFRRADIGVTQRVVDSGRLERLIIVQNRRSQSAVVDWVNAVFGELMVQGGSQLVRSGAQSVRGGVQASFGELMFKDEAQDEREQPAQVQAKYIPLEAHDKHQIGTGVVSVFGGASQDRADDVRRRQARDVAAIVGGVGELRVYDKGKKCARAARLRDVCVLVRSRTGLGILERGLEDAGIPYRLEGGSLLFDTQEVRDMLNCLRAIDDPTDEVSVVAALRSPAFACSDVDLMRWREGGGWWDYLARGLDDRARAAESPVGDGLVALRDYHNGRLGKSAAQLIAEFTRDRRLDELDLAEARPREAWRRRRFLLEEARARDAAGANTLNQFIRWAARQQEEGAQIQQPDMPDGDEDAVRIMTMHGSKGLEFPIVILLGLDSAGGGARGGAAVQFDKDTNSVEVAFSKDFRTPGYDALDEGEKRHSEAEAVRLAYVAATRARDYLYVSLHHKAGSDGAPKDDVIAGKIQEMSDDLPHTWLDLSEALPVRDAAAASSDGATLVDDYDIDAWRERRAAAIGKSAAALAVTATRVARNAKDRPDDWGDIEDKESEPDDERPWLAGRGGTAVGSAVHATLQSALELLAPRLPLGAGDDLDGLVAGYEAEIRRLADRQAAQHGVADKAEVARLAGDALAHEAVGAALRARRRWSEISVAAPLEVDGRAVALEGIIDLLYETDDGELVILDYKTDDVRSAGELERKRARYRYQGACYAYAVERATGKRVRAVQFLFIRRARAGDGLQEVDFMPLLDELPGLVGGA